MSDKLNTPANSPKAAKRRKQRRGDGSIHKRVSSAGVVTYILKYPGPKQADGKRKRCYHYLRGCTEAEAKLKLKELVVAVGRNTHVERSELTVGKWLETWLVEEAKGEVSTRTYERYSELLRLHIVPKLGALRLQDLTVDAIKSHYAHLLAAGRRVARRGEDGTVEDQQVGLSRVTVQHIHRTFSQAIKEAYTRGKLFANPFEKMGRPRRTRRKRVTRGEVQPGKPNVRALDRTELERLLTALGAVSSQPRRQGRPNNWRDLFPIVAIAAGTGMRRGEILALTWRNVDLEIGSVTVASSVSITKADGIKIEETKTASSERTIGIDPGLVDMLRAHRAALAEDALKCGHRIAPDSLVFPASPAELSTPRDPNLVTKSFQTAARAFGFRGLRFHDLRHTHATLQLMAGTPINAVQRRLGHSTPVITLSTYGHVLRDAEDRAVAVSGSLLAGALARYRSR